jgi:Tfp pilus assembly protein PilF
VGSSTTRRVLAAAGVVAFAAIAGLVLASALGTRLPGQSSSGNTVSEAARLRTLERAVADRPDDPAARLSLARFLAARRRFDRARAQYVEAARLDPANAEAQANAGWLTYQLDGTAAQARAHLDAALAADDTYPEAHFFAGVVSLREGDPAGAVPSFQRFLTLVPAGPAADQARELLAAAVAAEGTTTVPRP